MEKPVFERANVLLPICLIIVRKGKLSFSAELVVDEVASVRTSVRSLQSAVALTHIFTGEFEPFSNISRAAPLIRFLYSAHRAEFDFAK